MKHDKLTEQDPAFRGVIGVGRRDMTPDAGIYCHMWGSATHDQAESIHRPLHASALCIQNAAGDRRVVIATIDYCWFPSHRTVEELCAPVRAEFGLEKHELLLIVTHSHSVPQVDAEFESRPGGDRIPAFRAKLHRALQEAVREAVATAAPAILSWTRGHCSLARKRDFPDPESGRILCGPNPGGDADPTVLVGRVTALADGRTLATLVNYACHPVSLGGGNRSVSPDYVGAMSETVEAAGAKSVGLIAATTRPLTEASRTSVPWVTGAMRRRSALAATAEERQPEKSHTESITRPMRPTATPTRRAAMRPVLGSIGRSWPDTRTSSGAN